MFTSVLLRQCTFICLLAAMPVAAESAPAGKTCLDTEGTDEIVRQVNELRASNGLGKVSVSPALTTAAEVHSRSMRERSEMTHAGPDGTRVSDRVKKQGYRYRVVAENVAAGQESVDAVMTAWKNSPSHLENILRPRIVEIGVACFSENVTDYGTWWTMVLAAPLEER